MSCVSHAFASVHCCLVVTCWEGLTFWLLLVMFIVFLLYSHMVSLVRCGTWLYRILILAVFLAMTMYLYFVSSTFKIDLIASDVDLLKSYI